MAERRKTQPVSKAVKIATLKPDPRNANKGTKRGREALSMSLRDLGAGRSILLDKDGTVIAGNKTLEEAKALGHTKVRIIQTDGTELVAVQRTDLDLATDPRAKKLAIADNRVSELDLSWDQDVLGAIGEEIDLKDLFGDASTAAAADGAVPENAYKNQYGVIVLCDSEQEQKEMYERLQKEGLKLRVVTT